MRSLVLFCFEEGGKGGREGRIPNLTLAEWRPLTLWEAGGGGLRKVAGHADHEQRGRRKKGGK